MDDKQNPMNSLDSTSTRQPGLEKLLALSSHASGFKRENAVRRLGMLGNPVAIPYLIVRVNDWVPQIRAAARDALSKLLSEGHGQEFVASLPAIMHLQTCTRADHRQLVQAVQDFLLREENAPHLVSGMLSPDARASRLATRLLAEHQRVAAAVLVAAGLSHKDVVVRSIVINLLSRLEEGPFSEAVAKALRDPYMPVRREAFQQLLLRDLEAGLRVARDLLFDRSAAIREIAVRRLVEAGQPVEQIYTDALSEKGGRVAIVTCVLWSWAFMNIQARSEHVRQLLRAPSPTTRRAAVQTLAKLLVKGAVPDLEAALADESPAVCKEAARLIIKVDGSPGAQRLVSIASASGLAHVVLACGRIARQGGKWDWLEFILKQYGPPDAVVTQETFSTEIDAWEQRFNRSGAFPDANSLREIVSALPACEARLKANQLRLLEFTLRGYGASL